MIRRLFFSALLAASSALGQLQIFAIEEGVEHLVEAQFSVGTVPAGDSQETAFRIKNVGTAPVVLSTLSVAGAGFSLVTPLQPQQIGAAASVDFTVRFQPKDAGSFSANLRADGVSVILRGMGLAAPALYVEEDGMRRLLTSGSTVDFGNIERGANGLRRFVLENQTSQQLKIAQMAVQGTSFRINASSAGPLAPREWLSLEVAFEPQQTAVMTGTLQIDQRRITLRGTGVPARLPRPEIVVDLENAQSAQQGKLTVRLASPSRSSGTGQVQMEFRPSVGGGTDDPAILFTATGSRRATFQVAETDTAGHFGVQPAIDFQTGTTAGAIVFTVQLGDVTEQASIAIAPAPIGVDTTRGTRSAGGLEVRIQGFDNTHSASRLSFTFFDASGRAVNPGAIQVDGAAAFRQHFASAGVGGMFSVQAVFPVTGDAQQIREAEVEMTNSVGTTTTKRIGFTP